MSSAAQMDLGSSAPYIASAPPLAHGEPVTAPQRFAFSGTGSEYFRIWIVNLMLTVLTLGVYSAWAKVRRLRYFYRNTSMAGARFDYHGAPTAILKGRVLALALAGAYQLALHVSGIAALVLGLLLVAVMPWLLARSLRFKLANSSYCGVRFRFDGTSAQAYRTLAVFPLALGVAILLTWSVATSFSGQPALVLITGMLCALAVFGSAVLTHFWIKRYQHQHAQLGQTRFYFHAHARSFFHLYLKTIGLFVLSAVLVGVFTFLCKSALPIDTSGPLGSLLGIGVGMLSAYALFLLVQPFFDSRLQNLVWNQTDLGEHQFTSEAKAHKLALLHAANLVLIVLSAGLYKPFAVVRVLKYRIESLSLVPNGALEDFHSAPQDDRTGALGQEAGDFFNIDISL